MGLIFFIMSYSHPYFQDWKCSHPTLRNKCTLSAKLRFLISFLRGKRIDTAVRAPRDLEFRKADPEPQWLAGPIFAIMSTGSSEFTLPSNLLLAVFLGRTYSVILHHSSIYCHTVSCNVFTFFSFKISKVILQHLRGSCFFSHSCSVVCSGLDLWLFPRWFQSFWFHVLLYHRHQVPSLAHTI